MNKTREDLLRFWIEYMYYEVWNSDDRDFSFNSFMMWLLTRSNVAKIDMGSKNYDNFIKWLKESE